MQTDHPAGTAGAQGTGTGSAATAGAGATVPDDWPLPRAAGPVRALVRVPGSKSMTNRALVLAALAEGPVTIKGPLAARDTALMADALRTLGAEVTESPGSWQVTPAPAGDRPASSHGAGRRSLRVDVGNAGTVLRFVPPVAALTEADVAFSGDPRIAQRPVGPLLDALRQFGADISGAGSVPFVVHGHGGLAGGAVTLDASQSSQLISGLLLAAARFGKGAEVEHQGKAVPSAPHIEMTVRMLRAIGIEVQRDEATAPDTWRVLPGPISVSRIEIEPDLSNALPFLAAALATGGEVTVADWPADSVQPAGRIIELLTALGAEAARTPAGLRVAGSGRIRGVRANLGEVGELTPVLTALAALADSRSEFTGIGHLRTHESDRLAALAHEIGKLGGDVTELDDGLAIRPAPLRADGVIFDSHDDHRLVMAAAVLGLVTGGLTVHNAGTVGKTFPGFGQLWARLLAPAG